MKRKLLGLLLSFCMAAALLPERRLQKKPRTRGMAQRTPHGMIPMISRLHYEILTAEELAGLALLVNDGTDFVNSLYSQDRY